MCLELKILRRYFKKGYTIGRFFVNDRSLCDTIEDPIRELNDYNHDGDFDDPGEGKIYGRTAIPAGRYKVKFTYSPKLKRKLPLLSQVPGFSGIRIHGLKNAKWSEGCPGVGENKKPGELVNYKYWETIICQLVEKTIKEGREIFITIKQ